MHPFRFGVMAGPASDRRGWLEEVRSIEDRGYSTVVISEHFSAKWAPLPALAVAAEHTGLRVGTLVLANDFRHPTVLAKEAATVDLLSDGRLELGVGTGWEEGDYAASGIEHASPAVQVDRFEEAVAVLKALWSPGRTEIDGEHYQIHLDGRPKPASGGPTLLIGGGARRMLGIAGRHADIVGLSAGEITARAELARAITAAGDLMDQKLEWVRSGAGDRFADLEFNILVFGTVVTADRRRGAAELADRWDATPEAILASPHFLVGTIEEIAQDLLERRERWGISYLVIGAASAAAFAPVVESLTGT